MLEETTGAEIEEMKEENAIFPPLDGKRYWTTVAVLATTAVVTFLIANWALPSKVDDMRDELKEMRIEQATKADVDKALEDSREYTDKRVKALESDLKLSIDRVLTNQRHFKEDLQEHKVERKELRKSVEEIQADVARVKFAVERVQ